MKLIFFLITFSVFSQVEIERFNYFDVAYDSIGTHRVSYFLTKQMVDEDDSRNRRYFRKFNGIRSSDYKGSGYHRGHLAPADTFSFNLYAHRDTYSLANVAAMSPSLNLGAWKKAENEDRRKASEMGCLFVTIKVKYGDNKYGKLHIPDSFIRVVETCSGELMSEFEFENLK